MGRAGVSGRLEEPSDAGYVAAHVLALVATSGALADHEDVHGIRVVSCADESVRR
jgi:hypothetical protein